MQKIDSFEGTHQCGSASQLWLSELLAHISEWSVKQARGARYRKDESTNGCFTRDSTERRVATEQFVPSNTREHDFVAPLGGSLTGEPRVHAVDRRLIHCVEEPRQILFELCLRHTPDGVREAVVRGDRFRHRHFVLRHAGELVETERDGLDTSSQSGRDSGYSRRVDTA